MEVQALDARIRTCLAPQPVEVVAARSRTLGTDEHPTVGTVLGVAVEMRADLREDRGRNGNRALAGCALGCLDLPLPVVQFGDGAADANGPTVEIDVTTVQPDQLT